MQVVLWSDSGSANSTRYGISDGNIRLCEKKEPLSEDDAIRKEGLHLLESEKPNLMKEPVNVGWRWSSDQPPHGKVPEKMPLPDGREKVDEGCYEMRFYEKRLSGRLDPDTSGYPSYFVGKPHLVFEGREMLDD